MCMTGQYNICMLIPGAIWDWLGALRAVMDDPRWYWGAQYGDERGTGRCGALTLCKRWRIKYRAYAMQLHTATGMQYLHDATTGVCVGLVRVCRRGGFLNSTG